MATDTRQTPELRHLSGILNRPLVDAATGDRLGRVRDVIVRIGDSPHPPVTGLVVKIGGRELFVPVRKISAIEPGRVTFDGAKVDLRRFERRPGELLLAQDLMARHLINLVGGRIIRANEIELARTENGWEVVGVDPTARGTLRRLLPGRLGQRSGAGAIVDWGSIEPFVSHVPTARLRIPYRKLARLHPAQIADLVEAASHEEGEEIIEAVGQDPALEADVFEELDPEHQVEFVEARSDPEAAQLLGSMAADDAADLISELDQERRAPILELLPEPQRKKVRSLLRYHPETAGGLMSPDFLELPGTTTVEAALAAIRVSSVPPEALAVVFASGPDGRVAGTVSAVKLIQSARDARVSEVASGEVGHVHPDWDLGAVVRKMSDYNLTVAPVLDPDHATILGAITVDDVLELLLPTGFRRDYGMTAAEE
jgi:CBS domain-containing protein